MAGFVADGLIPRIEGIDPAVGGREVCLGYG